MKPNHAFSLGVACLFIPFHLNAGEVLNEAAAAISDEELARLYGQAACTCGDLGIALCANANNIAPTHQCSVSDGSDPNSIIPIGACNDEGDPGLSEYALRNWECQHTNEDRECTLTQVNNDCIKSQSGECITTHNEGNNTYTCQFTLVGQPTWMGKRAHSDGDLCPDAVAD
jgi:hypothetical protein